ncbi:MAG: NACHT domain-containing protein [Anaerolineaceae bacterium]|nr:NACHT domain-containing protein [Anaerolineaceae bacterium]
MQSLKFFLLGEIRIEKKGKPLTAIRSKKLSGLLYYLLIENTRPVQRSELIHLIWEDSSESTARNNLRVALYRLNKMFEMDKRVPFILSQNNTLHANPQCGYFFDVHAFSQCIQKYRMMLEREKELPRAAVQDLQNALELYQGNLLENYFMDCSNFDDWLFFKREDLRQMAFWAADRLIDFHEEHQRYDTCLKYTQFKLRLDPWTETNHRQHMRFLAMNQQRNQAIQHFQTLTKTLDEELNSTPHPDTRALYEQIRMNQFKTKAPTRPLGPTNGGRLHNFPPTHTNFVGREQEIKKVIELLRDPNCTLLNIVGQGGVGKTRLAIEIARTVAPDYRDGVYFVPLEALNTTHFFATKVAEILGIQISSSNASRSQLMQGLENKQVLIILDNVEQLTSINHFLRALLERVPTIKLLLTSRNRLNLHSEWVYTIEGLPYPLTTEEQAQDPASFPAVNLFIQNMHRILSSFDRPSPDELGDIVRICQLVGGLPLAIELAASWTPVLNFHEISNEIDKSIDFLRTSYDDLPERHRNLRAVFDYSWEMLTPNERQVFEKLAIFPGGFKRDIAGVVADADLNSLVALMQKSFVDRSAKSGRYYIHPLLKQYANEQRLKEWKNQPDKESEFRTQYCRYYLQFVKERFLSMVDHQKYLELSEVHYELPNVRQAWNEALTHRLYNDMINAAPGMTHYFLREQNVEDGLMLFEPIINQLRWMIHQIAPEQPERKIYQTIMAALLVEKSILLTAQDSPDRGCETAKQACDYAKQSKDVRMQFLCAVNHALSCTNVSDMENTEMQLEQAVRLAKSPQIDSADIQIGFALAQCFQARGKLLQAKNRPTQAVEAFQTSNRYYHSLHLNHFVQQNQDQIAALQK